MSGLFGASPLRGGMGAGERDAAGRSPNARVNESALMPEDASSEGACARGYYSKSQPPAYSHLMSFRSSWEKPFSLLL